MKAIHKYIILFLIIFSTNFSTASDDKVDTAELISILKPVIYGDFYTIDKFAYAAQIDWWSVTPIQTRQLMVYHLHDIEEQFRKLFEEQCGVNYEGCYIHTERVKVYEVFRDEYDPDVLGYVVTGFLVGVPDDIDPDKKTGFRIVFSNRGTMEQGPAFFVLD